MDAPPVLLLKLTLVPLLIAAVTLAGRRWGDRAAWLLMALPVVAGPTLYFYAVEQGPAFAADAARATLLGLVAAAALSIAYVWLSTHWSWLPTLFLSWAAFGMVTMPLFEVELSAVGAFAAAVVALLAVRTAIPRVTALAGPVSRPWWDVPLRMLAASVLVVVLTSVADRLGARVSGALTPFPVATAIIAAFTHAQEGPGAVARFFRGFIPGLCTFALFCAVLATALQSLPVATSFIVALAVQVAAQALITFGDRGDV